jgi:hypothetical protein
MGTMAMVAGVGTATLTAARMMTTKAGTVAAAARTVAAAARTWVAARVAPHELAAVMKGLRREWCWVLSMNCEREMRWRLIGVET